MQTEGLYPIASDAGVKRDGTEFESNYYSDCLWCRFQRGKPRKIGGYNQISDAFTGIMRGSATASANGYVYIYGGGSSALQMLAINNPYAGAGAISDRTPAGFASSSNNVWQFDTLFDAGGTANRIIAHAGQNLAAIDSTVQTPIYFGTTTATAALTSTGTSVSGGIVSLYPYLLALDNDGYVQWTPPNTMSFAGAGSGSARIAGSKLIKGVPTRGGSGYSPSGLIFSLDQLFRAYFTGGSTIFAFDYMGDTSLLSTSGVVEYNGRYYWPDLNGWKTYAGTIEDMPNDMNLNYFYDNYNKAARQKIWGIKNPRFNEIWWFWPKGNATECTDVIIYNIKEKTWYDTPWQQNEYARSTGVFSNVFPYPLMFGIDVNGVGNSSLWQHEYGVNKQINSATYALQSYFETANLSYNDDIVPGTGFQGIDRWVECMRIEPDFVQSGDMSVTIKGKKYAQSDEVVSSEAFVFSPTTDKIDMKEQRRQMTMKFESNVVDGDYQLGQTMATMIVGDGRQ